MKIKNPTHYYKTSTSSRWRKLGDVLLSVGATMTGFAIYEEMKWVAITALVITVVGKFLTNFFSEE